MQYETQIGILWPGYVTPVKFDLRITYVVDAISGNQSIDWMDELRNKIEVGRHYDGFETRYYPSSILSLMNWEESLALDRLLVKEWNQAREFVVEKVGA